MDFLNNFFRMYYIMYIIIITALCVVLFFISAFYCKEIMLNEKLLNSLETPSIVNCPIKQNIANEGLDYFKTKKVIITGLLRNSSDTLPTIKNNISKISKWFKDYKVLIVENDSVDNTRINLLNWADENDKVTILGCGINVKKCELKLPKTIVKTRDDKRINKMVFLRNIYLHHIKNNIDSFKDFEYMICIDMDLKGTVYKEGIGSSGYHFKNKPDLDAMCANGIHVLNMGFFTVTSYHDFYAHKDFNDIKKEKKFDLISNNLFNQGLNFSLSVDNCNIENELLHVKSCFNGFMIYKLSSLIDLNYELDFDEIYNEAECEHVTLNKKLKNVYMNPSLLFFILKNK
jgi:hypothetical protein